MDKEERIGRWRGKMTAEKNIFLGKGGNNGGRGGGRKDAVWGIQYDYYDGHFGMI